MLWNNFEINLIQNLIKEMTYNPFKKDINDLTYEDLSVLIDNEIDEGWYIEYKRDVPKLNLSTKFDPVKISKTIASFANTKGGWVFWGINCVGNKPSSIEGFNINDNNNFEDQIAKIINSNVSPVPIYHFKRIELPNNNIVFIILIEESPTPPYITSKGIIFQRENNESKPIQDRYIIEKLNEKTNHYYESIEKFTQFDLPQTKGQSETNQTYLELYLYPLPFDGYKFKRFYTSDFFKEVAEIFYQNFNVNWKADNDENLIIPLNFGFNSIYSSEGSLIVRPLKEETLIYKSTTLELFENGNLKLLLPLYEFDTVNAPKHYNNSNTLKYLLNKYSPNETIERNDYSLPWGIENTNLPPITRRKETDFVNHIKFIDGFELIISVILIMSKYLEVIKINEFDIESKIGFRAKITNSWRKFVFFDNDDYLEKLKLYNIPLSPKNEIEIPEFIKGNSYTTKFSDEGRYFQIAKFILEGIGLPDSQSINYSEIIKKGLKRFNSYDEN